MNDRVSLCKSNIKLPENRNYVSKHLYECSYRLSKIMPIYQTDLYSLLQIKGKDSQKK